MASARIMVVAMAAIVAALLCLSTVSAQVCVSTVTTWKNDTTCAVDPLATVSAANAACTPFLGGAYAKLSCAASTLDAAWSLGVYADSSCSSAIATPVSGSGNGCSNVTVVTGGTYYFSANCTCDSYVSSSSAGSQLTASSSTGTNTDVCYRSANQFSDAACATLTNTITGTVSGACSKLGSYYLTLTCANQTADSAWNVKGYLAAGCSGTALLTKDSAGTGCAALTTQLGSLYVNVNCSCGAAATTTSSSASIVLSSSASSRMSSGSAAMSTGHGSTGGSSGASLSAASGRHSVLAVAGVPVMALLAVLAAVVLA